MVREIWFVEGLRPPVISCPVFFSQGTVLPYLTLRAGGASFDVSLCSAAWALPVAGDLTIPLRKVDG